MFTIDNKITIGLILEDYEVTYFNFVKIIVDQNWDLELPKMQLHLKFKTVTKELEFITKRNFEIKLSYGATKENTIEYIFKTSNITMKPSKDGFDFIIYAVGDFSLYNNTPYQVSINGTSDEVLNSLVNVKPELDYVGEDEQVWINPYNHERHFTHKVLESSYIGEEDFLVSALTIDGSLRVRKYSDMDEDTDKAFSNTSKREGIVFSDFTFETDRAIFDKAFQNGRKLRLVKFVSNDNYAKNAEIEIAEQANEVTLTRDLPSRIDNGNCHDNYYNALIGNLKHKMNVESNKILLQLKDRDFSEDSIRLLDIFSLHITTGSDEVLEQFQHNYLVIGKKLMLTHDNVSATVTLAKETL